jgi:hypothetical protein
MKKVLSVEQVVQYLCRAEGNVEEVNIAQMSEILGIFADLLVNQPHMIQWLASYGEERLARRQEAEN